MHAAAGRGYVECVGVASGTAHGMRADIQALRAVAIIAVVLNHLWPGQVVGGYIGVDVFFVVSGFLITSQLLREGRSTGRIRLGAFWARRARRLLPAALLVLLLCFLFTVFVLPITQRQETFTQIGSAALYILNWVLSADSLDYFAQGGDQTLVTHYWSLSVEEQFYAVWPLLLLAAFLCVRRRSRRVQRIVIAGTLIAVLVLSLAWAAYASIRIPDAAYFQTSGRAWEFGVGALLALLPAFTSSTRQRLVALTWAGWAAIVASVFVLNGSSGVPGPAALLPVLGAAAVIFVGQEPGHWSPWRLTSLRPLQTVGDVSYSAYLWHYPLIIGTVALLGPIDDVVKAVILVLTLGIAWLSKRYVEDPVRRGAPARWRPAIALVATFALMGTFFGGSAAAADTIERSTAGARAALEAGARDPGPCFGAQASLSGETCPGSHELADSNDLLINTKLDFNTDIDCRVSVPDGTDASLCVVGVPESQARMHIAVVGDSHAMMWMPAFDAIAQQRAAYVEMLGRSGCPPTLDLELRGDVPSDTDGCRQWRSTVIDAVAKDPDIDVVVTSSRASIYRTPDGKADSGAGYLQAWNEWLAAGKKVIVIVDVPEFPVPPASCTVRAAPSAEPCTIPAPAAGGSSILAEAAAQISNPNFFSVDYTPVLCGTVCHGVVGGIPAYADSNHLSRYFTRSFATDFLREQLDAIQAAP